MATTSELTDTSLNIAGTTTINGIESTLSNNSSKVATSSAILTAINNSASNVSSYVDNAISNISSRIDNIRNKFRVGHEAYDIYAQTSWFNTGIGLTIPGNCIYMIQFRPRYYYNAPLDSAISTSSTAAIWENVGVAPRNVNDTYPNSVAVGYTPTGFNVYCWARYNTADHSAGPDQGIIDWVIIDLSNW